jgi:HK97 family phage major capsid protein
MSKYRNPVDIKAEIEDRLVDLEAMAAHEEATVEGLEEIKASVEELKAELASSERFEQLREEIVAERTAAAQAAVQPPVEVEEVQAEDHKEEEMKLPAVVATSRTRHFASAEDAFVSGKAILAMAGDNGAQQFMNDLSTGGSNGESNTIPAPLSNALINLIEDYGVARQACKRIVMTQNTWDVPKLNGHVSINYTGEAQSISSSDVSFGQVSLVAKKMTALSKVSSEMTEDSIISVMDVIVEDMARQIALEEDKNLFLGVSGGLLETVDAVKGNTAIAERTVANVGAIALSDLTALTVATGNPIVGARNEWWINPTLFHGAIRDLLLAAGGNTQSVIEGGQRPTLLGYPVNFVNVLDGASASASDSLLCVFGDVNQACYFGERRGLNFRVLNELYANTDQVGVQCTQRSALKVANPEVLAKLTIA